MEQPMKNTLDFNLQFSGLEAQSFIQCFASAYMYIEGEAHPETIFYEPEIGGMCYGCNGDRCPQDKNAAKRCAFFFLFNTMCGNSAIRRRFDGTPTEMQELTGYTAESNYGCGTEHTIDFLFGYTGYRCRKRTDPDKIKREVVASIDAGKPVIVKAKIKGNATPADRACTTTSEAPFYIITGYDGDAIICAYTPLMDFSADPPSVVPEKELTYPEIEALYLFGEKTERRYTLKDGLNNIRRVMEYNINAGLWDEYLEKLGGIGLAGPEQRKYRAQQWAATNVYMYNFCSFGGAFRSERLPGHYLHKEMTTPALDELWRKIGDYFIIVDAGHVTGKLNWEQIWNIDDPAKLAALSEEACEAVATAQRADREVLGIIKQAISVCSAAKK